MSVFIRVWLVYFIIYSCICVIEKTHIKIQTLYTITLCRKPLWNCLIKKGYIGYLKEIISKLIDACDKVICKTIDDIPHYIYFLVTMK